MKVLIFGPSGAGKSYISAAWQKMGVLAFDADNIEGLSCWYDRSGKKITGPVSADEVAEHSYSFLWSKKFLNAFLERYEQDVFIFGGAGNITHVLDLFDKVFFLKVEPALQKARLLNCDRPTPHLDFDEKGELITWGGWFEELALKLHIPFIHADQSPMAIYQLICGHQ